MALIMPDSSGDQPEIMPPETPEPDIDPSSTPDEMPQQNPGEGGDDGDTRPHGGQ